MQKKERGNVKLRVRGVELRLAVGSYVVGRSQGCDILLESSQVSRRHARIEVASDKVSIEDLGSANGVFVNGFGIGPGPHSVEDGDRIQIGGESLHLAIGDSPEPRRRSRTVETAAELHTDLADFEDEEVPSTVSTKHTNALVLVGQVVERALAEGRINDAADMIRAHLLKVLHDAKIGRPLPDPTVKAAIAWAVRLADATLRAEWMEYLFRLLTALRAPLDDDLLRSVKKLLARVEGVSAATLHAYAGAMKAGAADAQALWSAHQAELLAREIAPQAH